MCQDEFSTKECRTTWKYKSTLCTTVWRVDWSRKQLRGETRKRHGTIRTTQTKHLQDPAAVRIAAPCPGRHSALATPTPRLLQLPVSVLPSPQCTWVILTNVTMLKKTEQRDTCCQALQHQRNTWEEWFWIASWVCVRWRSQEEGGLGHRGSCFE